MGLFMDDHGIPIATNSFPGNTLDHQTLRKWQVDLMPGDFYRFMGINHPDLKLTLDSFGIEILPKFYRRAELKQIKTSMEKIM
jgi:hypothetical protein